MEFAPEELAALDEGSSWEDLTFVDIAALLGKEPIDGVAPFEGNKVFVVAPVVEGSEDPPG